MSRIVCPSCGIAWLADCGCDAAAAREERESEARWAAQYQREAESAREEARRMGELLVRYHDVLRALYDFALKSNPLTFREKQAVEGARALLAAWPGGEK